MCEFNFKSQVCTDKVQSERLLALGLKKETADAIIPIKFNPDKFPTLVPQDFWISDDPFYRNIREGSIPAWSLHRLMILAEMKGTAFSDLNTAYETTISIIAAKIRFGYFNKEYLV